MVILSSIDQLSMAAAGKHVDGRLYFYEANKAAPPIFAGRSLIVTIAHVWQCIKSNPGRSRCSSLSPHPRSWLVLHLPIRRLVLRQYRHLRRLTPAIGESKQKFGHGSIEASLICESNIMTVFCAGAGIFHRRCFGLTSPFGKCRVRYRPCTSASQLFLFGPSTATSSTSESVILLSVYPLNWHPRSHSHRHAALGLHTPQTLLTVEQLDLSCAKWTDRIKRPWLEGQCGLAYLRYRLLWTHSCFG